MRYVLTMLSIFAGECFLKNHIEANVPENGEKKVLRGAVILTKHHNRGAALNTGERHPGIIRAVSAATVTVAMALFAFGSGRMRKPMMKWGLSLLLGGGLSNTWDRFRRGYVVDYFRLNVPAKRLRRLIFNLSDFSIMLGTALMVFANMESEK